MWHGASVINLAPSIPAVRQSCIKEAMIYDIGPDGKNPWAYTGSRPGNQQIVAAIMVFLEWLRESEARALRVARRGVALLAIAILAGPLLWQVQQGGNFPRNQFRRRCSSRRRSYWQTWLRQLS